MKRKIVLITGGTSGIGLATAKQFIKGAIVLINSEKELTSDLKNDLDKISSNYEFISANMSNTDNVEIVFSYQKNMEN